MKLDFFVRVKYQSSTIWYFCAWPRPTLWRH